MSGSSSYSDRILHIRKELKYGGKTDKNGNVVSKYDKPSTSPKAEASTCISRK